MEGGFWLEEICCGCVPNPGSGRCLSPSLWTRVTSQPPRAGDCGENPHNSVASGEGGFQYERGDTLVEKGLKRKTGKKKKKKSLRRRKGKRQEGLPVSQSRCPGRGRPFWSTPSVWEVAHVSSSALLH